VAGLQDCRFHTVCRVNAVFSYVAPNVVEIAEGQWSQLEWPRHFSGRLSLRPTLLKDLDGFLGIDKFSTPSLRKALFDLGGDF